MQENIELENALNELIEKCAKAGGHVWIVDKMQNRFSFRVQEPVKVIALIPTARGDNDG